MIVENILFIHLIILNFLQLTQSNFLSLKNASYTNSKEEHSKHENTNLRSSSTYIDLSNSLDPCKARLFLGDIALDEHDVTTIFGETIDEVVDSMTSSHQNPFDFDVDQVDKVSNITALNKKYNKRRNFLSKKCGRIRRRHKSSTLENFHGIKHKKGRKQIQKKSKSSIPIGVPSLSEFSEIIDQEINSRQFDLVDLSREMQKKTKQERQKQRRKCRSGKRNRYRSRNQRTEKVFKRYKRAATAVPERIWPSGVVPYYISSNFTGAQKAIFRKAMRHWENHTCITFIERTDEESYIIFTSRPCGCCSYVGRRGGRPQAISIGENCDKFGIVVHELGHVIGFWHEHTRPDRDNHIQIIYQNIQEGQEYNFNKMGYSEIDSLGEKYDFYSIMHYSRNTFSKGKFLDTILANKDEQSGIRPRIGQRIQLSSGDIRQANKLYSCPDCGGTLQMSSGEIFSPNYPDGYDSGLSCVWRISVTPGEKIVVRFRSLEVFNSKNCYYDHLVIHDGHWQRSPLIGRYCGRKTPVEILSKSSRLWIRFQTISNFRGAGFHLEYEAVCGGEMERDYGEIQSPNYPEEYSPDKSCVWNLKVEEGYTIGILVHEFQMEEHDSCAYDYFEVRDGPSENSKLIGRYCGYEIPNEFKSSGNTLWVKFNSDSSVSKAGISASFFKEWDECENNNGDCDQICENTLGSYKCGCNPGFDLSNDGRTCIVACGGYVTAQQGEITSPNWPSDYPINKQCTWQVVAPFQHKITIEFEEFKLEGDGETCKYDYLEIQSGLNSGANLHGKFCGEEKPSSITSTVNEMRITFVSDDTVASHGFRILYHFDKDECASNNGGCNHICTNTIGDYYCKCQAGYMLQVDRHTCAEATCEHEITSHVGTLSSPNWPNRYSSGEDCTWHISTVKGHRIKIMFDEFDLESQPECEYDHVDIYDGRDVSADRIGRFCGSQRPHEMVTSGNEIFIKFESDKSVEKLGFRASHTTICGGNLTANNQEKSLFSHPQYGSTNYNDGHDCKWVISAKENKEIVLTSESFHIEDEKDCSYDYVEIFDGRSIDSTRIGRYCGKKVIKTVRSKGADLLIRFRSDDTINNKGFNFTYNAVEESKPRRKNRSKTSERSSRRRRRRRRRLT